MNGSSDGLARSSSLSGESPGHSTPGSIPRARIPLKTPVPITEAGDFREPAPRSWLALKVGHEGEGTFRWLGRERAQAFERLSSIFGSCLGAAELR